MQKINVGTLFSGYDSQCLALNRLGIPYELVFWSEIDKYAIHAHNALFPQYADRNLGDITEIDWSVVKEPVDLMTYSSPCQDFSNAGLQRGGEEGSDTRSGLLWECEKAIRALRPKYLVFENVSALTSEKFMPTFLAWGRRLQDLGYENHWQIINAKDYGVPQNRSRVFMVSVRDGGRYIFPQPYRLTRRLKDVLENEVPENYYLSDERVASLLSEGEKETDISRVGTMNDGQSGRVYSIEGISPTIDASAPAHNRGVQISEGMVNKTIIEDFYANPMSDRQQFVKEEKTKVRVRKLTERELFRLMDVDESDIDVLLGCGVSKSQLAKMAGNSIVVNCLYHIFDRLLVHTEAQENEQLTLF